MKATIRLIFITLLIACYMLPTRVYSMSTSTNNDFEMLMKKIRQNFVSNPTIEEDLKLYNPNGSFSDVDYGSIQRTNWPPMIHIERLYNFSFAYTNPLNKYYKNDSLFHKIKKGLEFWHERNPNCNNWWYNQIAEPQHLGILLIQMRTGEKQLPTELENNLLERMRKDGGNPTKSTGANRTDIALHWIYRACLTENETDLKIALENVYSPITYTTKEGFQHDNCYFQHGAQLYIGGYGDEILKGVTQVAMYTKGTKYAVSNEQLALLSKFMRETYFTTIRGQYMLFDVLGRSVSRPNSTKKAHTALFAKRMLELDPTHSDEYKAIIERLSGKQPANYRLTPRHTHYFRGDYTLHVRPGYTFDVRMVSNRTSRCEYGNGENLKTYFLSDGCTNIVVNGNEYTNIFPVWNWTRIPGVTAPQCNEIPKAKNDWQSPGTSTFAGGVSDSIYGVSAYAYWDTHANINTGAQKAWFFFDEEVVCLGAGIRSDSEDHVATTINQCLLSDKSVIISANKKQALLPEGTHKYTSPQWILHSNIGYVFPKGGNVFITNQTQTGSWYEINNTASKKMQQEKVITIGLDHGRKVTDASYAYIVVPGKQTVEDMKAYEKANNIEIWSNSKERQVVRNKKLGIWQMVFYTAGEFRNKEIIVKVSKGCTLMIKDIKKKEATLHIADPAQTQEMIRVDLCIPEKSKERKNIDCDFSHSSIYAGASQKHLLQFE